MNAKNHLESDSEKERLRRIATFPDSKNSSESNRNDPLSPFEEEKIELITARVAQAGTVDSAAPAIARVWLSSACYHNCSGCSFTSDQKKDRAFLNASYFRKLVDELHSMHIRLIDLTGGAEPTLHPQFVDFAKMCVSREFQMALLSNGTWTDPRLPDLLVDGFSFLRVNLDSCGGEVYDRMHRPPVPGGFQRIMNNLERMILEREKRKSGLIIRAKARLSQINMNYVEGIITSAKDLGVDYVQFQIGKRISEALLAEQKAGIASILNRLKNQHSWQIIYGDLEGRKKGDGGWASNLQLTINHSGDVYSCPHSPGSDGCFPFRQIPSPNFH